MSTDITSLDYIPEKPVPLTPEQAEAMAQKQIKKHHVAIILLHWFNAIVWGIEAATGAALITSQHFRFAPEWYIHMVSTFFGSRANLLHFHIAVGLAWIFVFLVYGIFGARTYLHREVLEKEVALDGDDFRWLWIRTLRLLGRTDEELPLQGSYNAGQKMFALAVYSLVPVIIVTGLIMVFHLGSTELIRAAIVAHFAAVGLIVSGLMVHVYMAAVFPEEKPAFFSMFTGKVNALFAYHHHFKWWREYKEEELAWKESVRRQAGLLSKDDLMEEETIEQDATGASAGEAGHEEPVPPGWFARIFRQPGYWPPYAAGFGLGLTLLATFVLMGEGLGASSAFIRWTAFALNAVAPGHVAASDFWGRYVSGGQSPLINFLVFEVIGVAIGGLVSGWLAGRVRLSVEKGPRISNGRRYTFALIGGIVTGVGARLGRGCTSGQALSGGAALAAGSWVFMFAVFAAGFLGAIAVRRNWL